MNALGPKGFPRVPRKTPALQKSPTLPQKRRLDPN